MVCVMRTATWGARAGRERGRICGSGTTTILPSWIDASAHGKPFFFLCCEPGVGLCYALFYVEGGQRIEYRDAQPPHWMEAKMRRGGEGRGETHPRGFWYAGGLYRGMCTPVYGVVHEFSCMKPRRLLDGSCAGMVDPNVASGMISIDAVSLQIGRE